MDFVDLLAEHRVECHTSGPKCTRGFINFKCPFCERDPYMGYRVSSRFVTCWNCGPHSLVETIQLITGLERRAIIDLIGSLPKENFNFTRKAGKFQPPDGIGPLTGYHHRQYLRSRKLMPSQMAQMWSVGQIGQLGGSVKWSLYIPVVLHGEVVSWTTRTIIKDKEPRYRSATDECSDVPIFDLIYGIDFCYASVLLVEGPVDVWKFGPGAAACLGTSVTPARQEQLSRIPQRFVCFDNEPKAQERARKLCDDLSVFDGVTTNVVLQSAKDLGDAEDSEVNELRKLVNCVS